MISTSQSVWVVDYARTAFSRAHPVKTHLDVFADMPAIEMIGQLINGLLQRGKHDSQAIKQLSIGCALPVQEQWSFGGRYAVWLSGLSEQCSSVHLEQQCASGLSSLVYSSAMIAHGGVHLAIAGGYENMTRIPIGPKLFNDGTLGFPKKAIKHAVPALDLNTAMNMGLTAEKLAKKYHIDAVTMNQFAVQSHLKAHQATDVFEKQIIPITSEQSKKIYLDDNVRPESTVESLAQLRPAFDEQGIITAGTSSPLSSGAAAVILASDQAVNEYALNAQVRVLSMTNVGVDPTLMGFGVVPAIEQLLKQSKLVPSDIDLWEINEAFSVVPLVACSHFKIPQEKLNIHGGALAIGHPLGASGTRIVGQLAQSLINTQAHYGVASLCVGGGQGVAILLENTQPSKVNE